MKSKQLNFFIVPEDWDIINNFLKENGILLVKEILSEEELQRMTTKNFALTTDGVYKFYLTKADFVNKIIWKKNLDNNFFYIDSLRSDVIEFDKGGFFSYSPNTLHRARLYFNKGYFTDNGIVYKNDEFIEWAEEVFKSLRKTFFKKIKGISSVYFSENSLEWKELVNAEFDTTQTKLSVSKK